MIQTRRHAMSGLPRDCGLRVPTRRIRPSFRLAGFAVLAGAWVLGLSWFASESYSAPRKKKSSADAELVKDLTARLGDSRSVIRREAVVRLAQLGPAAHEALGGLKRCLEDTDPYVRAHAARATFRVGLSPQPAVRVLIELLQPDDPQLCCLVSLILGEIGPAAHPALATLQTCMAKRPDTSVRLHAAGSLPAHRRLPRSGDARIAGGHGRRQIRYQVFCRQCLGERGHRRSSGALRIALGAD